MHSQQAHVAYRSSDCLKMDSVNARHAARHKAASWALFLRARWAVMSGVLMLREH